MDLDLMTNILYAMIMTGTPLLLVALGEMVCEKSGVLNLGQEGMMLMGAVSGFIAMYHTESHVMAFAFAMLVGMFMSLLFGFIVLNLNANQVATGLALTIFGTGLSEFVGTNYEGKQIPVLQSFSIDALQAIPLIGKPLFAQNAIVYLSWCLVIIVYLFFRYNRHGLSTRAVGEDPSVASNLGLPVMRIRYLSVMFGGAMAGLAGGYLSIAYTPMWTEGMVSGKGWIALTLVVFASWRIERVILGAYLFGFASIMHLVAQGLNWSISSNLLAMMPYVATLVVLIMLSRDKQRLRLFEPMSLGKPWHKNS